MTKSHILLGLLLAAGLNAPALAEPKVDAKLPVYAPTSGVSGNLSSVGSDTLANLMTFWAEEYKKLYPNVNIQIQAQGSSTAPPALTEGTSNLGPMSRKMKGEEIEAFEKKNGYKPTAVPVAIDGLAVFVHKDNPIKFLTIAQVDAIFSATRKCGGAADIASWGDLGLTGAWAPRQLQLFGRNSVSGTYGYFKEHALFKGDYKDTVKEQPGSSAVVQAVASDRYGIGYSGIGYKTADVKAVPLLDKAGKPIEASMANAYNGTYPLSRFLLIYVNREPNKPLDPLRLEFLRYVLSRQGQEAVVKDGYIPLPLNILQQEMKSLGLPGIE